MINNLEELAAFYKAFTGRSGQELGADTNSIPDHTPAPLRELYELLGKDFPTRADPQSQGRYPFSTQDFLAGPDHVQLVGEGQVEFAWECQENWSCRSSLHGDDPEVLSDASELLGEGAGFEVVAPQLSHFLITMTLQELLLSRRYVFASDGHLPKQPTARSVEPIWLRGPYAYSEPMHNFYYSSKPKALLMELDGVWVGGDSVEVGQLTSDMSAWCRVH